MSDDNMPKVIKIGDKLVLDDPQALAAIKAVAKYNCQKTLHDQGERVNHFHNRMQEKGLTPDKVVVVLVNVDDRNGRPLSEVLMPGVSAAEWQTIRDRGEVPFARGLAERVGIHYALSLFDKEAAQKLQDNLGSVTVVVDYGCAEVFPYERK